MKLSAWRDRVTASRADVEDLRRPRRKPVTRRATSTLPKTLTAVYRCRTCREVVMHGYTWVVQHPMFGPEYRCHGTLEYLGLFYWHGDRALPFNPPAVESLRVWRSDFEKEEDNS